MESIRTMADIPALPDNTVHIWGAEVPRCLNQLKKLQRFLSDDEEEKALRYVRAADQQASVISRGALRTLLAAYSGKKAGELVFHYSENGKPHCPESGLTFNVSHSRDWVVLAIGRNRQLGVDVEHIRRDLDVLRISERYFTPEETRLIRSSADPYQTFFHHWARKEAYVKAAGSALFRELAGFAVPDDDAEKDGWFFQRLEAGSKYAAAVVTDKPLDNVTCFDFGGLKWDS